MCVRTWKRLGVCITRCSRKRINVCAACATIPHGHRRVPSHGRAEIVGLERYPELGNAIVEKYIPADQRQQFEASNQEISRASRVVIVLKPEKVVGWAWTAL